MKLVRNDLCVKDINTSYGLGRTGELPDGNTRTDFKPNPSEHRYATNLECYNAQ